LLSPSSSAMRSIVTKLDISIGISGPHDFAVRDASLVSRCSHVHRILRPTFVTIAIRPSHQGHRTREEVPAICPTPQVNAPATDWHDGQIRSSAGEAKRRMSIINRVAITSHRSLRRLLFQGFPHRGATLESQASGGDDGNDKQIKCDFPAPIAQKHWKNRGRRQKIAKNPEKNCVEASCSASGAL
jgi:hypothetical protein